MMSGFLFFTLEHTLSHTHTRSLPKVYARTRTDDDDDDDDETHTQAGDKRQEVGKIRNDRFSWIMRLKSLRIRRTGWQ